jgi:hypothetical protein
MGAGEVKGVKIKVEERERTKICGKMCDKPYPRATVTMIMFQAVEECAIRPN